MSVESLLAEVGKELKAGELARKRYAPLLSPDFNVFSYIEPDELRLSRIIADLLDPKGRHAQGAVFLERFLVWIGTTDWHAEDATSAWIEVPTTHNESKDRRLDILVDWRGDKRGLAIENKPWALDQTTQIEDYAAEMKKRYGDSWRLVYLAGMEGQVPDEGSIAKVARKELEDSGNLVMKCYESMLTDWIDPCMAVCQSERFRWFLKEFKSYVEATFMGVKDMTEMKEIAKKLIGSKESIEAMLSIREAYPEAMGILIEKLAGQLQDKKPSSEWCVKMQLSNPEKRHGGIEILFTQETKQSYWVRFDFNDSMYNGLLFGIMANPTSGADRNNANWREIAALMKDKMEETNLIGEESENWPWWSWMEERYRYWYKYADPWAGIIDDKETPTACELFRIAKLIYEKVYLGHEALFI